MSARGVIRRLLAATLVVVLAVPALAQGDEDERARRESEIFGAPADDDEADDETPPSEGEEPDDDAEATPGAEETLGEDAPASPLQEITQGETAGADVLRELDRALDVGGRVYLALQYSISDGDEPLFPPLTSPSLLDLYADARPSSRVRAYAEARLDYDFTAAEGEGELPVDSAFGFVRPRQQLRLDQLWLKLDVGRTAFLTLGKQRIRWGSGRFWNPTDFLNQTVRDPLDVFDRRLGVNLVKVHFPLEALASNLYLIGDLEDVHGPDDVGLAARAEAAFWTTEVSASASVRRGEPLRFGADISSGVWLLDLRAEAAATFNSSQPFFEGDVDLARGVLPTEVSRADEWLFQLVLGGEIAIPYSSTDSVLVGAEYFYNDAGYDDADLYPLLFARGAFRPLYVGRHYAAAYLVLLQPGILDDASLIVSAIGNLSDQSFLTRLDFSTLLLTFMTLNLWVATHYGNEGELRLGVDIPPLPGVPGAEEGLSASPPLVDVGGALTLHF